MSVLMFAVLLMTTTGPAAAVQPDSADINRLGWLAGCWALPRADGLTEEHWMRPSGGTMLAMSRTVRADRTVEYEFLRIAVIDGRLALIAKPSGQAEATFPLRSLTDLEVVFENLAHDFPQRISYRRGDDGSITARAEASVDGQTRGVDFAYRRCG